MNDLVSIVMPSYNTGAYIFDSIQSVLNQTYQNWELIIVDDCSTDNTDEVVAPLLNDKRIQYIKNDSNSGAAFSRNLALREAKGKWVAFLDSDDLWLPEKLSKQLLFMENNGYHFSYTNYLEIDVDSNLKGTRVTGPRTITKTGFNNYCWPGCLTVMYDKDYVGLIQIPNLKKNNDYAMWLLVSQHANCYLLNEELALYRCGRVGSISNASIIRMIQWHYLLFKQVKCQNSVVAIISTLRNMLFGVYKKIIYVTKDV